MDKELNLEPERLPEPAGGDDIKPDQPKKIPEPIKEAKAVVTRNPRADFGYAGKRILPTSVQTDSPGA